MFTRAARTLRPIISTSAKRCASTSSSSSSSYSSSVPVTRFMNGRNAIIGATTITISALALLSEQRRVYNDSKPSVRESVLDQPSLKEPIHKRESQDKATTQSQAGAEVSGSEEAKEVIEEKSEQAAQPSTGAFNEETGEINWDCPCLGGMADGPCGEQFKAAFSCFVFSEAEPKGVDCVELFKVMQDCFREHPEIYGEEIDDEEENSSASQSETPSDIPPIPTSEQPDSHPPTNKSTPSKA